MTAEIWKVKYTYKHSYGFIEINCHHNSVFNKCPVLKWKSEVGF